MANNVFSPNAYFSPIEMTHSLNTLDTHCGYDTHKSTKGQVYFGIQLSFFSFEVSAYPFL